MRPNLYSVRVHATACSIQVLLQLAESQSGSSGRAASALHPLVLARATQAIQFQVSFAPFGRRIAQESSNQEVKFA